MECLLWSECLIQMGIGCRTVRAWAALPLVCRFCILKGFTTSGNYGLTGIAVMGLESMERSSLH